MTDNRKTTILDNLRAATRLLENMPDDRSHQAELNFASTRNLRKWLESPNGSWSDGRVTVEAVEGGGILVRTRSYEPGD